MEKVLLPFTSTLATPSFAPESKTLVVRFPCSQFKSWLERVLTHRPAIEWLWKAHELFSPKNGEVVMPLQLVWQTSKTPFHTLGLVYSRP
jgi:hypothetical protein